MKQSTLYKSQNPINDVKVSTSAGGRHTNIFRAWALAEASKPSLDYKQAWGSLSGIMNYARAYASENENKRIVLTNDKSILKLPYTTRFSEGYYTKVSKKLKNSVDFETGLFLTVTMNPRGYTSLSKAMFHVRSAWHKLYTAMRQDVERGASNVVGWDSEFLLVVEFQQENENYTPHLHILMRNCVFVDADWLRSLWRDKYHIGTFVKCEQVKSNRTRVISYLLKYMSKTMASGVNPSSALLWATNSRMWTTSRGIFNNGSKTNCNNSTGEWRFLCAVSLSTCQNWHTYADYLEAFPPDT